MGDGKVIRTDEERGEGMRWMRREGAPQEKLRKCWRLIEIGQNMAEVVRAYTSISLYLVQLNRLYIVLNENQFSIFQFDF